MDEIQPTPTRIDRHETGPPVEAHGHTIWPEAHLTGWQATSISRGSAAAGALVRVRPTRVRVKGPDGDERHLTVADPTGEAIRGMIVAGAVVAAVAVAIVVAGTGANWRNRARRGRRRLRARIGRAHGPDDLRQSEDTET